MEAAGHCGLAAAGRPYRRPPALPDRTALPDSYGAIDAGESLLASRRWRLKLGLQEDHGEAGTGRETERL